MLKYSPKSAAKSPSSKKALFLDRDGVINLDVNYTHKIEDFNFIDGIFSLCQTAIEHDYRIIIVTNQSGIARGYYSEADFAKLTKWMFREFAKRNIEISKLYACPHLVDATLECYRQDCQARKPNPGMLLQAQKDFNLDLSECIFIGDKISDMEAGLAAKITHLILLDNKALLAENLAKKINIVANLEQAEQNFLHIM
jgi:D-glycero-D-manno-heptose 1,7-bisphosphate phosphatase